MDKFLKIYNLLIESGRIENMKRPIINNEIEAVVKIKSFQQIKVQDQMASLVSSDTHLEKS